MFKIAWPYVVLIVGLCIAIGFYLRSSREGFQTAVSGGSGAPGSTTCNMFLMAKERFVDALNKAQSENDKVKTEIMQAGLNSINDEIQKIGCIV
jgi:hypothetical protein